MALFGESNAISQKHQAIPDQLGSSPEFRPLIPCTNPLDRRILLNIENNR